MSAAKRRAAPAWGMSLALALAIGAGMGALSPLFTVATWWVGAEAVVVVVLVAITAARALVPWRPLVPVVAPVFGSVVLLLIVNAANAGDQSLFGVIPTLESLTQLKTVADNASIDISGSTVPMVPKAPINFLLMLGAGIVAIGVEIIAIGARKPALVGIPLGALLVIPSLFGANSDRWFYVALAAAAYLLVLYLGIGETRPAGAIGVGASGIIAALLLPLVLPAVVAGDRLEFSGAGYVAVNDFIDLGHDLQLKDPVSVLSYRSLTGDPEYLRLGSIVDFTGSQWTVEDALRRPSASVAAIDPAPGLEPSTETVSRTTSIQIISLTGSRLPVPYAPRSITGLTGNWGWDTRDLTVSSESERPQGAAYVVTSDLAVPSAGQLSALTKADATEFAEYLDIPADIPSIVFDTAKKVTRGSKSDFDSAIALQDYFTSGEFDYSESTPAAQGYDGSGGAVLGQFLQTKSGYCVHFASAMAVMARSLGIPSRIALGFVPGTYVEPEGEEDPYYLVTSRDLHTWPELYFDTVGWVRFEPTPSRGEAPDFTANTPLPSDGSPTEDPVETSDPTPTSEPQTSDAPTFDPNVGNQPATGSAELTARITAIVLALGLLAVLVVPLLPALRRLVRRLLRYRRVWARGDALAAWNEVHDTALDAGIITRDAGAETTTPRELAELLAPVVTDRESLDRLLEAIETDAYSRGAGTAALADLRLVRTSIVAALTLRERVVAVLTPASMRSVVTQFADE
jgi:transglutaminase-like putative cysteine protease